MTDSFSRRYGFAKSSEITVRTDAPADIRFAVLQKAADLGMRPGSLRAIVCKILLLPPDPSNWSEYPNIWDEVQRLVNECPWYRVYDLIEELCKTLGPPYQEEMNVVFLERGVGWKVENGRVVTRGDEPFEVALTTAENELTATQRLTARTEISEALSDLSRRPNADISGAIQHGVAALECVARDVTGLPKATLGDIVKARSDIFPAPLGLAVDKLWGFSSEYGRHVREGRPPAFEEAEFVVTIAASIATYISRKNR